MSESIIRCPACGARNRIPGEKSRLPAKCGRCGGSLPGSGEAKVVELDDQGFEKTVHGSSLPVLVDFYSPTCGPCRMLAPVMEELARAYGGRMLVARLDTSRHQMTASRFRIRGVPTLIFFKGGRAVDQLVGAVPREQIEQKIRALL